MLTAKVPLSGIITPARAQDTGLVPRGFKVWTDNLEGQISLANLDYSIRPAWKGERNVDGDTMLRRANSANAYGSLGFAAELLKAQDQGMEIFPCQSRGEHYFLMPRTILLDRRDRRNMAYFMWYRGRWQLCLDPLYEFYSHRARFVLSRREANLGRRAA